MSSIKLRIAAIIVAGCVMNATHAKADDANPNWKASLFDAIDLSRPEMSVLREAVARGDMATSTHAWADYLHHRTGVPPTYDLKLPVSGSAFHDPVADAAAVGKVQGGNVPLMHTFPGNKIDWLFNATAGQPGVSLNLEWQYQLCRMSFWNNLATAYRATGDQRYADAWVAQFRSFADQCPPPAKLANREGSAWRTIDTGIRVSKSWPDAFFTFLTSPAFTDDDIARFTYFAMMQGRYLRTYPTVGNWLTMEMRGLYTTGCVFPEFKEAADWRSYAGQQMRKQETAQFLPDGAQFELSTGYHDVALNNLVDLQRIAKLFGRLDDLPEGYVAGLEKAYDFDLYLMTPDRKLPLFNDSWPVGVDRQLRIASEFFPAREDFKWVGSAGNVGKPPAVTSKEFPWAGFYVMRSGWETDANYLAFRAGPLGAGHVHQDKLNVVLWSYGRQILYDSGGGSYEKSQWREFGVSTFDHNTVIVDGKPQVRSTADRFANVSKQPIDADWQSTPAHDFARGTYADGYGAVDAKIATHTRRVLFLKPDLMIVADTLVPRDSASHVYEARWNLLTTHSTLDKSLKSVVTTDPGLPNMAVVPLKADGLEVRSASAETSPRLLGWNVVKDEVPQNRPATTVLHTVRGTGTQSLVTLLVPLREGSGNPVRAVRPAGTGTWTAEFADGRRLKITVDPEPTGAVSAVETLPNGTAGRHASVDAVSPVAR